MTSWAYYYFLSIALVITTSVYIFNLFYIRMKGKTTYGITLKVGTPGYARVVKLANTRNISIFLALDLFFVLNLVHSITGVMHQRSRDAHFFLIFAPIMALVFIATVGFKGRNFSNHSQK
jgi:hypothetical protein